MRNIILLLMFMAFLVLVAGIAYAAYLVLQVVSADAPGHCSTATTECSDVKLSYANILTLAQNAGFGGDSGTAAAVALAESGGDANAYNPETQACTPDGEGSVGLWQIYRKVHPEFSCVDLTDPQLNANAAFSVYNEAGGFTPWSTFKSGAYEQYLQS